FGSDIAIMSPARIPGQLTSSFSSGSAGTAIPLARSQIVWQCDRLATTMPVGVIRSPPSRHICCGQPLVTTGCGYLPTGYLPTGYLPIGALPTGGAGGGGSLRGRSAAAAALSTVNSPTVVNTAMNPAVLTTARNAVVTRIMIFITLSPFVEALARATEGCPYFPSGRAVSTAVLISFAEHDFARHNILNERLTGIFTRRIAHLRSMHSHLRSAAQPIASAPHLGAFWLPLISRRAQSYRWLRVQGSHYVRGPPRR